MTRQVIAAVMTVIWVSAVWGEQGAPVQGPAAPDQSKPVEAKADPDATVLSLSGLDLKNWQAQVLVENRAGNDLVSAADFWTTVQLKAQEARRRGIDKTPEGAFMLQFFQDYFLGTLLDKKLTAEAPKATEEQARADYEAHPEQYKQTFMASIEHLTLSQRDKAKEAVKELQAQGADFGAIYERYQPSSTDRSKGRLYSATLDRLKMTIGDEATQAVQSGKVNDVIGPFLGLKGFEVIRIKSLRPERMPTFEELKEQIITQLSRKAQSEYPKKLLEELKKKAKIKESQQLIKARADKESAASQVPAKKSAAPVRR